MTAKWPRLREAIASNNFVLFAIFFLPGTVLIADSDRILEDWKFVFGIFLVSISTIFFYFPVMRMTRILFFVSTSSASFTAMTALLNGRPDSSKQLLVYCVILLIFIFSTIAIHFHEKAIAK